MYFRKLLLKLTVLRSLKEKYPYNINTILYLLILLLIGTGFNSCYKIKSQFFSPPFDTLYAHTRQQITADEYDSVSFRYTLKVLSPDSLHLMILCVQDGCFGTDSEVYMVKEEKIGRVRSEKYHIYNGKEKDKLFKDRTEFLNYLGKCGFLMTREKENPFPDATHYWFVNLRKQ